MTVLETERLVLRKLHEDDGPFVFTLYNEPSFLRYIGDRGIGSLAAAQAYLENSLIASYEELGFGLYGVALKDAVELVGICGLLHRAILEDVDLGFAFFPAYWRQGYATEAGTGVLAHAKRNLGLKRVVAVAQPDNAGSIRTLEKLGMTYEKEACLAEDGPQLSLFAITL